MIYYLISTFFPPKISRQKFLYYYVAINRPYIKVADFSHSLYISDLENITEAEILQPLFIRAPEVTPKTLL